MGNRKKIVASLTGAAAFIVAPFIHGAFSAAASNTDNSPANVSISTTSTPSVRTSNSDNSDDSSDATDNGDKDHDNMPV